MTDTFLIPGEFLVEQRVAGDVCAKLTPNSTPLTMFELLEPVSLVDLLV